MIFRSLKRRVRVTRVLLAAGLLAAGYVPAAQAITINLSYDNPQNDPAYDPTGSKLAAVMQTAVQIWEKLQPDNQTFNVTVHYNTIDPSSSTLAFYNPIDSTITVRSNNNWFIDANVNNTTDFGSFSQTLVRDLTGAQRIAAFNSSGTTPPSLLEAGYTAGALTAAASSNFDMLSVLTHELGHMTGIGTNFLNPDVDLPSNFVGDIGGIKAKRADNAHIAGPDTLMQPGIPPGVRRLPSALDVIVNAHEKSFGAISLARVDYLGSPFNPANFWGIPFGWEGGQVPGSQTDVFLRWGGSMLLASAGSSRSLYMSDSTKLLLLDQLQVGGGLSLQCSDNSSGITVGVGGQLNVGGDALLNKGSINLQGSTVSIDGKLTTINSRVSGFGVIHSQALDNSGVLVGDGGLLRVQSDSDIRLSGTNQHGSVFARTGDVNLERNILGPFQGTVEIGTGHQFSYIGPMLLSGAISFTNSPDSGVGKFFGAPGASLTVNGGYAVVEANMSAVIDVPQIDFQTGDSNHHVAGVDSGAVLTLAGATNLGNAAIVGQGALRLNAPVSVYGNFGLQTSNLDWDGYQVATPTVTTVATGGKLSITADALDPTGFYNGTLQLHSSGEASVTLTSGFGIWSAGPNSAIRFLGGGKVSGSPLFTHGTVEVISGTGTFAPSVFLGSTSQVVVHDGATLDFLDQVVYSGGQVTTPNGKINTGMIRQYGPGSVSGVQVITTGYFNWDPSSQTDSSTTIQANALLEVFTLRIGSPLGPKSTSGFGDTIKINSGQLSIVLQSVRDVGTADDFWALNSGGVIALNHTEQALPTVSGSPLQSHGVIQGEGVILSDLTSDGLIATGGMGSVGTITTAGVFSELAAGKLDFDLAGKVAGTSFDQLLVDFKGHLDGELDVHLQSGFEPVAGDRFRIIDGPDAASLDGTFAVLNLPPLVNGAWNVAYGSHSVELQVVAVPEPSTLVLFAAGMVAAMVFRRGTRRKGSPSQLGG
jgi:hypothetical protein